MIFEKKKILVWCDDPPEDRVISIIAGCLVNDDHAHSLWFINLEVLLDPQPRKPPTMELSWSTVRRIMTLIPVEYETVLPGGVLMLQTLTDGVRDPKVSNGDSESCPSIVWRHEVITTESVYDILLCGTISLILGRGGWSSTHVSSSSRQTTPCLQSPLNSSFTTGVSGPEPYPYTLTSPRESCQLSSENLLLSLTMWKDERDDIEGLEVKFWK